MVEKNLCFGCNICCRYIVIEIDKPENKEDFDEIRWFLAHKDTWVFIDNDDSWNVQFNTPCEEIDNNGLCSIYEKRPQVCRNYCHEECEKYGEGDSFKVLWKTIEEFEEWLKDEKKIDGDD